MLFWFDIFEFNSLFSKILLEVWEKGFNTVFVIVVSFLIWVKQLFDLSSLKFIELLLFLFISFWLCSMISTCCIFLLFKQDLFINFVSNFSFWIQNGLDSCVWIFKKGFNTFLFSLVIKLLKFDWLLIILFTFVFIWFSLIKFNEGVSVNLFWELSVFEKTNKLLLFIFLVILLFSIAFEFCA